MARWYFMIHGQSAEIRDEADDQGVALAVVPWLTRDTVGQHRDKVALITAAPELADALQMLIESCNDCRMSGPGWDDLRASVSAAKRVLLNSKDQTV